MDKIKVDVQGEGGGYETHELRESEHTEDGLTDEQRQVCVGYKDKMSGQDRHLVRGSDLYRLGIALAFHDKAHRLYSSGRARALEASREGWVCPQDFYNCAEFDAICTALAKLDE